MNVQVVPKTNFVHNEYTGARGVPMPMKIEQAKLLRDHGLVEEFDETQTFDDAEAEARAAEEKAKAEEAAARGASVKIAPKPANKQAKSPANK